MHCSGVYLIRSLNTGFIYVGASKNVTKRWRIHRSLLNNNKHPCLDLQKEWVKSGKDSIVFEVYKEAPVGDLSKLEIETLEHFKTKGNLYNKKITRAGRLDKEVSEEERRKTSIRLQGVNSPLSKLTEEDVKKILEKASAGARASELCKEFNSSRNNISTILARKSWRHLGYLELSDKSHPCRKVGRSSKLGEAEVIEIRKLLSLGRTQAVVAKQFGVDQNTITMINTGNLFKWVK